MRGSGACEAAATRARSFSFLLGWHDYMPFLPVPSLWDLLGR
jgi:hypothetical protein